MLDEAILEPVPDSVADQVATGAFKLLGTMLRDMATGAIVAHLQETKGAQTVLEKNLAVLGASFLAPDMTGAVPGGAEAAKVATELGQVGKLFGMGAATGGMPMALSVAGIGVTAASTALILKRLDTVDRSLERIEQRITALPEKMQSILREDRVRATLVSVKSPLMRLEDASSRKDPMPVVRAAEEKLHAAYHTLHHELCEILSAPQIDSELLNSVVTATTLCASAEIRALYWMNEVDVAAQRARQQLNQFTNISLAMPRDRLAQRLQGGIGEATEIARDFSGIRMRVASHPHLAEHLLKAGIPGRAYIEAADAEREHPFLMLRTQAAAA